jgi:hypothetical protein
MIKIICAIVVIASFVAVLVTAAKGTHDYNSRRDQ